MTTRQNPSGSAKENRAVQALRTVIAFLLRNWPYKLLALAVATAIWATLITQDPTLTREKVLSDVTISVTGSDAMKRNGFIVTSDLSESLSGFTLRVDVPQGQYQAVTASTYNPRIELARVSEAGEQELRVAASSTATNGQVTEISPSTVKVTVERYITRSRIPVTVVMVGDMPEGWYAAAASADPPTVAVSGPESLVSSISRCEAYLDLSSLPAREGKIKNAVELVLMDSSGNAVNADNLEVTNEGVLIDTVNLEQQVYPTRAFAVVTDGLVTGTPASGYEVKSVSVDPANIRAAGTLASLEELEALYSEATVDVTGRSETFTRQIRVTRPTELAWISQGTVTATVKIGEITGSRSFQNLRVRTVGLPTGTKATLSEQSVRVTVKGAENELNKLRSNRITLTCDLSGLESGTHTVPVLADLGLDEVTSLEVEVVPASLDVTIQ